MANVHELEAFLYEKAPKDSAYSWDNVGHLVGNPAQNVTKILVALDATPAVAQEAIALRAELIVSHHPIMNCKWLPVQTLREDTVQGKLLRTLVKADIAVISMHTNLDMAEGGVNDVLAQTLGLTQVEPLGDDGLCRMGVLPQSMTLQAFAPLVKEALQGNGLRYSNGGIPVQRVAVGGGACKSYAQAAISAGCDTFVTSDVGYHDFLDAAQAGLNLIDAGHYPTENPICAVVAQWLREEFPAVEVVVSTSHQEVIEYLS